MAINEQESSKPTGTPRAGDDPDDPFHMDADECDAFDAWLDSDSGIATGCSDPHRD